VKLAERLQAAGLPVEDPAHPAEFSADAAVREGERAHYARGEVLHTEDPDLALLAGDHLYALGLADLAERGDLAGITRLAAIIARCAQAHAEGRPEDAAEAWEEM
jgi:hypothetical protein